MIQKTVPKKPRIDREDIILATITAALCAIVLFIILKPNSRASDEYVRERVLQLKGEHGALTCTGVQVKAPSGMVYTLTAGHCKAILDDDNRVTATDEQGRSKQIFLVDLDEETDLMLMSSTSYKSIEVASKTQRHEHVHTLTHGHMHETYRTDGELLEEQIVRFPLGYVLPGEEDECRPPNKIDNDYLIPTCVSEKLLMFTTAVVYPGSSGGPLLDNDGRLVGIVSITESDTIFSGMVTLDQIHAFLASR